MYCEKCKITIECDAKFCCECGTRLVEDPVEYAEAETRVKGELLRGALGGIRFNFSKPLCLLLALIMLATFFFPWMKANASMNDMKLLNNRGVSVCELPMFIKQCFATALNVAGPDAELTPEGEHLLWLLHGLLLTLGVIFLIIALHFVLFGISGIFTNGKLRYYFARTGGTLYFVFLCIFMLIVFVGNIALAALSKDTTSDGVIKLELSVAPTVYAYITAVLALLFRFLGIRVIRILNAQSCLNKGDHRTAEREIRMLGRKDLLENRNA